MWSKEGKNVEIPQADETSDSGVRYSGVRTDPKKSEYGPDEVSKIASLEKAEISTDLAMEVQKHTSIEEVPTFAI